MGQTYIAPVFSTSETDCHPGLFVCRTEEEVRVFCVEHNQDPGTIIKVQMKRKDVHRAGKKWRVREFKVMEGASVGTIEVTELELQVEFWKTKYEEATCTIRAI